MNDEIFDQYREAGAIAARVLKEGAAQVKVGVSMLELVEGIEARVIEEGAMLAFPLNVSRNEDAAHDTAVPGDTRTFAAGDLVKVDLGVHIDGYIADTAVTVDLGNNSLLVEASKSALESAIAAIRPGVTVGELGAAIQQEIEKRGYRPVMNLTGHGLRQYDLHSAPNIPNVGMQGGAVLQEGMAFAIEPFATTGSGRVSERSRVEIYQQIATKPTRLPSARKVLEHARKHRGLPFARRWVMDEKADLGLSTLVRAQILRGYPVLHDVAGSLVSQAEHTMIVTEDGCVVTTR